MLQSGLGKPSLKKRRNFEKNFLKRGGGQSVFILLFRNGQKWSKMAQMVQKISKKPKYLNVPKVREKQPFK